MIKGCDISQWQGRVDFQKLKDQGFEWVVAKATEGVAFTDAQFSRNREEAHKIGMPFGAYHFFHPAQDLDRQIKHFEDVIGPRQKGELPPWLDWETNDSGVTKGVQADRALKFCKEVQRISGCDPWVYGSAYWFEQFGGLPQFIDFPLVVAHYGVNHPFIPRPWKTFTAWQYAEDNGLDKDLFNGNMDRLKKFIFQ